MRVLPPRIVSRQFSVDGERRDLLVEAAADPNAGELLDAIARELDTDGAEASVRGEPVAAGEAASEGISTRDELVPRL